MNSNHIIELAKEIRRMSVILAHDTNTSHTGGALSMADVLAVLYSGVLNVAPETTGSPDRDRFILSKGHCCASLYSVLALKGFFDKKELMAGYGRDGSIFFTHASHKLNGVELSTGSLGHGLPVSTGMALGAKCQNRKFNVYCLVGDGELDEGSNWESIMFAAHNKLDNLCLIVDKNKIQALGDTTDVLCLDSLDDKFKAFHWNVINIDGHDVNQIAKAFEVFKNEKHIPTVIIANTIKGKGVSYMEGVLKWHYSAPNDELLKKALEDLK
ncbi:MAG: transketolase [Prevotellaceae bacterium]|nr:transketolase [Candidatus Faecinaster equi]